MKAETHPSKETGKTAPGPVTPGPVTPREPVTDRAGLLEAHLIKPTQAEHLTQVIETYPVRVPRALATRMATGGQNSPLARQYLPTPHELTQGVFEEADPIGDEKWSPVTGIVHRYPDRVLLKLLQVCPVYCRFCFRRAVVGPGRGGLSARQLAAALAYIRNHRTVWEVILTGGDPLMLTPRRLALVVSALDAMDHVGVIRLHTRVPVCEPERINARMILALQTRKSAVYMAIHANHADEFTDNVAQTCRRLSLAGIPLLGQSVLLKGVNDNAKALETLMRTMVVNRIKPYYLHHLDHAPGTGHFRVGIGHGQNLMRRLRGRVSGLCQPTYVLDIPGGYGKSPIGPTYASRREANTPTPNGVESWSILDYKGRAHLYPPGSEP